MATLGNPNGSLPASSYPHTGLTAGEVAALRRRHGENRLPADHGTPAWRILLGQVQSPLVYIILAAAGISLLVGERGDFLIIMAVVLVDLVLGFIQEYQANRTYVALKGLLRPTTTVFRGGSRQEIETWELVPGDLVLLNAGDKVPADGQLREAVRVAADEAILTGESEAVSKHALPGDIPEGRAGEPQTDTSLFMGTTVLTGRGILQVTATGMHTELGQIAASLGEHVEEDTPLQVRLKAFSRVLTVIVLSATLVILAVGLLKGREFLDMLRTAIILAIAAVPEGLLIAVTVILVLGMRRILRRNGLVKKLLAVETLGSVAVICTDKTGTLTEGRMRVTRTELADPDRAWRAMVLCNDLEGPVDIALWEHADSVQPDRAQELAERTRRLEEELFSSETRYMIAAVSEPGQETAPTHYLKGAPEVVLEMCALDRKETARWQGIVDQWANDGLRLLGLAMRQGGQIGDHSGYNWLGLLGMEDPVRAGVPEAVRLAQQAGVQVKMITGDHAGTAQRVAASTGIWKPSDSTLDGGQLAALTDEQLRGNLRTASVFARIHPQDKLRLVRALQADGLVTAMIGDGVNDAPALKRANIGVVVGAATDVAKETADLVLLDNSFETIVAAIEEGRVIFDNIRKVVAYTLSNSFAEVLTIFTAMMLGWPAPLAVAQILWIHLICDGPLDIVLSFEPKEEGIMAEPPRPLHAPILTPLALSLIGVISVTSSLFALLLFGHFYQIHHDPFEGRSIVFASFAVNSIVYIFAYRSLRLPLFRMAPLRANRPLIWATTAGFLTVAVAFLVPGLRELLGIVPLAWQEWLYVAAAALVLLLAVETGKALTRRNHGEHDRSRRDP